MAYLLDTNACIALINGSSEPVRKRLSKAVGSGEEVWVPSVSVFELWYGVAKSMQSDANARRVKMFLEGPVRVLEFGEGDAQYAGELRSTLERMGRPIGTYDVLIAGQALNHKLTLVTANVKEFGRVKGLDWEDWGRA
ncbi:MAG TPA: type II toxin-antitoxin system VapC family toxin [Candidatus Acidoferrum sp.]|nr:type II toxin-antitoxin system VapC family toxin [Candidatus Acidoferrum sp.]